MLAFAITMLMVVGMGQPEFDYGSEYEGSGSYECDISDPYYGTSCYDTGDDYGYCGDWNYLCDMYSDYYPDGYW